VSDPSEQAAEAACRSNGRSSGTANRGPLCGGTSGAAAGARGTGTWGPVAPVGVATVWHRKERLQVLIKENSLLILLGVNSF